MRDNKYNYNSQTGMFREKLQLRQRSVTQDDLLQDIETYTDWGTYWAMVKTLTNRERIEAGQEQLNYSKRFVIKYAKSLDEFIASDQATFEIIHKGITYNVKEAFNDNDLNKTITVFVTGSD